MRIWNDCEDQTCDPPDDPDCSNATNIVSGSISASASVAIPRDGWYLANGTCQWGIAWDYAGNPGVLSISAPECGANCPGPPDLEGGFGFTVGFKNGTWTLSSSFYLTIDCNPEANAAGGGEVDNISSIFGSHGMSIPGQTTFPWTYPGTASVTLNFS